MVTSRQAAVGYRLAVTENQRKFTEDAILLTGAPRSGTTLLGKIVGTLRGVDYHYEPPTAYMITSLVAAGQLPPEIAADILRVYLCEDYLIESAHGRRANLRPSDDSLTLNTLTWSSLLERWTRVRNRADAARWVAERGMRLAFKMPNMTDALEFFLGAFSKSQVLLSVRDGRQVIRSVLKKGWMKGESLKEEFWPHRAAASGAKVPYWVEESEVGRWASMGEATRACYMWRLLSQWALQALESPSASKDRLLVVRYEDLISQPEKTVAQVARFLGRPETDLTGTRTREIRVPESVAPGSDQEDFYSLVEPEELRRFKETNARWGYR